MDTAWKQVLWGQFGAAIEMLENAIAACPHEVWSDPSTKPAWVSRGVVGFWYLAYHTLFYLDLQLSGSADGFTPPPPFDLRELDPAGPIPDRPYGKDELQSYLRHCRAKCRATIDDLTDDKARQPCRYGTMELPFAELLLYGMRHVQHHAAQLNLLLRQSVDSAPRWVRRATAELSGE